MEIARVFLFFFHPIFELYLNTSVLYEDYEDDDEQYHKNFG